MNRADVMHKLCVRNHPFSTRALSQSGFSFHFAASHAASLNPCFVIFSVINYSTPRSAFCIYSRAKSRVGSPTA